MRRLLLFLLFLIASVWLGLQVMKHPGYVLLVYQPWLVQMPIWFALLAAIIFLSLFYLLVTSVDRLQLLWLRFSHWLHWRREQHAYTKTQRGLSALIEGRFKQAERLLLSSANQTSEPLIHYLGAAKAAQEQRAFDRRDRYLEKVYQMAPRAQLAIGLVQAELELAQDQLEQAVATLHRLRQTSPRHPRVLKLLEKAYVRLADWKNLQALLPALRKAKLLNAEQTEQFEKNLYCEMLRTSEQKSLDDLQQLWQGLPRYLKKNPEVVCAYVQQLLRYSDTRGVEELIRGVLKHHWQPELVRIYGRLPLLQLNRQLALVGAWLRKYGPHPELLLTLGKLCVRVQLWGKAKDYLEKCLAQGPCPEASLEYGQLLEHLGRLDEAVQRYREGLKVTG